MSNLFSTITPEAKSVSDQLFTKIQQVIKNSGGVIPFSSYMEMALYDPQFGYYNNFSHKFGKNGDFVTAPLLSELFAKSLSLQLSELFTKGVAPVVFEIGAGNGQLMLDILSEIGHKIDKYIILELSSELSIVQRNRVAKKYPEYLNKISWVKDFLSDFSGIILANEVLDAQPCELIKWNEKGIFRQGVANYVDDLPILGEHMLGNLVKINNNNYNEMKKLTLESSDNSNNVFKFVDMSINTEINEIIETLPIINEPYSSEINLLNRGFIRGLASNLNCGCILLIDYGYSAKEYYMPERRNGTLRGFFRHHIIDEVLCYPGLMDITANVDFSAIVNVAINCELDFIGYITQANFLLNCGLMDFMKNAFDNLPTTQYLKLSNEVNQLISPNNMGDIFKVIGFSKDVEFANWMGFSKGDLSYTL